MIGQAIRPRGYDPTVDILDPQTVRTGLGDIRMTVRKCVETMPSHQDFIDRNCRAGMPS
jgi:tryptophan halogenase